MIVVRCATGIALFQVTKSRIDDTITWTCLNDNATETQPRTNVGFEAFLRDLALHAVALRGAISNIIDLPEVQ